MMYTREQLAKTIGMHPRTFSRRIREWMEEGKFEKSIPNGYRFTEKDVEELSKLVGINLMK